MIKFNVFCLKLNYWRIVFVSVCLFGISSAFAQTINERVKDEWVDARYIVSTSDRTVIDQHTELMWTQCFHNFTNGGDCTTFVPIYPEGHDDAGHAVPSPGGYYNWPEALKIAANSTFAGYDDWRLPNMKEIYSLIAFNRNSPVVNETIFPNLLVPLQSGSSVKTNFWTSTHDTQDGEARAYAVDLSNGVTYVSDYSTSWDVNERRILLVRLGDK